MNTKTIAMTVSFTALTVILARIVIPAPYLPFLFYEIWEIPIVAAFFLMSAKQGIAILLLNTLVSMVFFPMVGIPGLNPIASLIACSSMLAGVFLAHKIGIQTANRTQAISGRKLVILATSLGIIFRVTIMTFFIYALFQSIGLGSASQQITMATLPLIGLFNVTLPLYTIPVGYFIAKTARSTLRMGKEIK